MPTISITSSDGKLSSAAGVLEVSATNPEYNQPVLRIKQAEERGGGGSIRIDELNPDIEFVEPDQDPNDPATGKHGRLNQELLCPLNTPRRYYNFACLSKTN